MALDMLERRKQKLIDGDEEAQVIDENSIKDTLFEANDFGIDFARTDILQSIEY